MMDLFEGFSSRHFLRNLEYLWKALRQAIELKNIT